MFRCSQPIEARSRPTIRAPSGGVQISPRRIEQSEPDLALELLSQLGTAQRAPSQSRKIRKRSDLGS